MSADDAVLTRLADGLLWITINRASSHNALSRELMFFRSSE